MDTEERKIAVMCTFMKPTKVASFTGIPIKDVKKIRDKYKSVLQSLNKTSLRNALQVSVMNALQEVAPSNGYEIKALVESIKMLEDNADAAKFSLVNINLDSAIKSLEETSTSFEKVLGG